MSEINGFRSKVQTFLWAATDERLGFWREMPDNWTPAGVLVSLAGRPQSTVSTWLTRLRDAGAVESRRIGRSIEYRPCASFDCSISLVRRPEDVAGRQAVEPTKEPVE